MKRLMATLLAGALVVGAPAVALAQHSGGHGGGGGFRSGGGSSYHGGGYGGYRGGYGGYRGGYGYRGYGYGYGYGWGAFGLGLALGSAYYDPWYSDYGYPGYYYAPAPYYPSAWDDEYDEGPPPAGGARTYAPPPSSAAPATSGAPRQACGEWVWKADQNKYVWQGGACT